MSRLTVFLARFIGLFTILLLVGLLTRGSAIVDAAMGDSPVMLVYAVISLATGVAMIFSGTMSGRAASCRWSSPWSDG